MKRRNMKTRADMQAVKTALASGATVYTLNPQRGWVECSHSYLARAVAFHERMTAEGHGRSYQWRTDLYAL